MSSTDPDSRARGASAPRRTGSTGDNGRSWSPGNVVSGTNGGSRNTTGQSIADIGCSGGSPSTSHGNAFPIGSRTGSVRNINPGGAISASGCNAGSPADAINVNWNWLLSPPVTTNAWSPAAASLMSGGASISSGTGTWPLRRPSWSYSMTSSEPVTGTNTMWPSAMTPAAARRGRPVCQRWLPVLRSSPRMTLSSDEKYTRSASTAMRPAGFAPTRTDHFRPPLLASRQ